MTEALRACYTRGIDFTTEALRACYTCGTDFTAEALHACYTCGTHFTAEALPVCYTRGTAFTTETLRSSGGNARSRAWDTAHPSAPTSQQVTASQRSDCTC